jgi:small GTP-binding protein
MTIIGDGAVGKTTLVKAMLRYTNDGEEFDDNQENLEEIKRTPFMEIESWNFKDLRIQCFDLAGQRTVGSHPLDILRNQVATSIDIYIFVFALNRFRSFENLHTWLELCFKGEKNGNVGFILVGNKSDLEKNVPEDLIKPIVGPNQYFDEYVETSAIQGKGIKNLLNKIAEIGKNLLDSN